VVADFPAETFRVDGAPSSVRGSAGRWETFGGEACSSACQIRSLDTSLFVGPEGDQYREGLTRDLPLQLDTAGRAYSTVAGALNCFTSTLSALQSRMSPLAVQAPGLWQALQVARGGVATAQQADQCHQRAVQIATEALRPGQALPADRYHFGTGAASVALSNAQQAWNQCLTSAQQIKAELSVAVTACSDTIQDAAGMRFKKNPHGLGALRAGFKNVVKDHLAGLAKLSGVLKTISVVAGVLSFVPVIGEIAAPIALATGVAALAIDTSIKFATGNGSWTSIAVDGALMALPGIGKLARNGLETAAGLTKFANNANNADTIAAGTCDVVKFPNRLAARQGLDGDLQTASNRFFRNATSKSQDFQVTKLRGGNTQMQFFSPANNPGYGKVYVQVIDSSGEVVTRYKDTVGPSGLIERKWIDGGS
jgi:hypothetical protein